MIIRYKLLRALHYEASILPSKNSLSPVPTRSLASPFSSSSQCRSRVGGAPLSLPAEVNLRILELPALRSKDITGAEPPKTVEVEGPLGTVKKSRARCQSLTSSR